MTLWQFGIACAVIACVGGIVGYLALQAASDRFRTAVMSLGDVRGKSAVRVQSALGEPDQVYSTGDRRILSWRGPTGYLFSVTVDPATNRVIGVVAADTTRG